MAYGRRKENVLVSSLLGVGAGIALTGGLIALLALSAEAQHGAHATAPGAYASERTAALHAPADPGAND